MISKIRILTLASLLVSGIAFAAGAVDATVAGVDAKAGTVSLTMADGTTASFKTEGKAVHEATMVKVGEKVDVTFRDDAAGAHQAITKIKREKAMAPAAPAKK